MLPSCRPKGVMPTPAMKTSLVIVLLRRWDEAVAGAGSGRLLNMNLNCHVDFGSRARFEIQAPERPRAFWEVDVRKDERFLAGLRVGMNDGEAVEQSPVREIDGREPRCG